MFPCLASITIFKLLIVCSHNDFQFLTATVTQDSVSLNLWNMCFNKEMDKRYVGCYGIQTQEGKHLWSIVEMRLGKCT